MTASKVLVACPNHVVKEYSFQRWIDAVTNLTYPNYDILVVDNSPAGELAERYAAQVPIVVIDDDSDLPEIPPYHGPGTSKWSRVHRSMELIRQHFLADDYSHWMNIESDVIPPSNVIEAMLECGHGGEWISHAYPVRGGRGMTTGIGCSLFSRRLIEAFDWQDAEDSYPPDAWLLHQVRPRARTYRTMDLWGYLEVAHLEDPLDAKKREMLRFASRVQDAERKAAPAPLRFARRARQFAGMKAAALSGRLARWARQV